MVSSEKSSVRNGIIRLLGGSFINDIYQGVARDQIAIFTLHRMSDPEHGIVGHSPEFLRSTLSLLRKLGYNLISMEDVCKRLRQEGPSLHKAVAFTMDDGFLDQALVAAPIFAEYDCPVTLFVISDFLDGKLWPWDDRVSYMFAKTDRTRLVLPIGDSEVTYNISSAAQRAFAIDDFRTRVKSISVVELNRALNDLSRIADVDPPTAPIAPYLPMTWEMARNLEGRGVRFAPHTASHHILSRLPKEQAEGEITESWRRLKEELTRPLPIFAYPTGRRTDFGIREFRLLEQIGILGAVTTVPGYADLRVKRDGGYAHFQLNRFAYPENIGDVVQYCSWLERTKMALRLEGTRSRATANYGGVRPAVRHYLEVIRYKLWGFQRFRNINWAQVKRVVFVCKGNICRSPYAEARAQKFGIEVASAGLTARSGAAANGAAMANAALRDVDIAQHRSRRMDDLTVGKGDLLVAMEPWQGDALLRTFRQSGAQTTLLGFWALPARPYIHDPYGHDEEYFQTCFSVIDMAVDRLMGRVVASETEPVGA